MKKPSVPISFHFHEVPANLRNRLGLKEFIRQLFRKEKKKLSQLTYIFCSDEYLLQINRDFLNHNYYTDIITFDLTDSASAEPSDSGIIGEIYISVDRVRENAASYNTSFNEELHRVVFHGALHLCGYGDKSLKEQKIMREKEDIYISTYFKS
ncbi:MAG TPA: rRNA maturation RNase YbeY [Parasegetibacter sp.]